MVKPVVVTTLVKLVGAISEAELAVVLDRIAPAPVDDDDEFPDGFPDDDMDDSNGDAANQVVQLQQQVQEQGQMQEQDQPPTRRPRLPDKVQGRENLQRTRL